MAVLLLLVMMAPGLPASASREVAAGECKAVDRDEIMVCGNRKRDERYRLPVRDGPFDPRSGSRNSSGGRGVESKTLKESAERAARLA